MLMTALTINITIKFINTLIITSLLIIPAATAHHFTHTPKQMADVTVLIKIITITNNLTFSTFYNTPTNPSIILYTTLLFILNIIKKQTS